MRGQSGEVFSIGESRPPAAGRTTSRRVWVSESLEVTHFGMGRGTDISAEFHPKAKLLLGDAGTVGVSVGGRAPLDLPAGGAILVPSDALLGLRSTEGGAFTELTLGASTVLSEDLKPNQVVWLPGLLPYEDGTIVNADLAHNDGMKFAIMSFDAGTGLSEHAAPGDALLYALDGEGVIGYEGKEYTLHAGQNFKFDAGGRHYVRAEKRFKMGLLLTLG